MKNLTPDKVVLSVSEFTILCGTWSDQLPELVGKELIVVNRKSKKIMGMFKVLSPPDELVSDEEEVITIVEKGKVIYKKDWVWREK